jgi:type VI secretion system protein ImpG
LSTFNKYFQEELAYLRELGREFSQSYPTLAPMLADRGGDPDVERLLEGVAFLTGRIRQKLDDEMPEVIVAIASLLFPHLVRPLPGCTILELAPFVYGSRERVVVPRGTEFASVEVEGTSCRFRSAFACELAPLSIEDVRLEALPAGRQELRILLQTVSGGRLSDVLPSALRLHFAGDLEDALRLWSWTLTHIAEVALVETRPDGRPGREHRLPRHAVRAYGFDEEDALLPMGRATFPGFRLLEEYYVLPQKFAFVEVNDIRAAAADLGAESGRFTLCLRFDRKLQEAAPVGKESIRLHCVPVVNVFSTTAEPIRLSPTRERFLVRPAGLHVKHGEVYSIERVSAIHRGSGRRVEIPSFYGFSHANSPGHSFFYTPHYAPSVVGDGVDLSVSFGTAIDVNALPDADTASIELLATNRALAGALRAGEVRVPTSTSPQGTSFRNLFAVTRHVSPPFGRELHWRVVAHAAMGIRSLTEPDVLRSVLEVYNLHAIVDRQAALANELRMNALKDVRVSAAERLYRGAPVRGVDVQVDVDESGFAGDGDLYLFGSVLERFFAHYVSLNTFSRTSLKGLSSNVTFGWPARSGALTML